MNYDEIREEILKSINALTKAYELLSDKLEPLMTVTDVAQYWNCSEAHVYNVEKSGAIAREPIPGIIRFKRSTILSIRVDLTA